MFRHLLWIGFLCGLSLLILSFFPTLAIPRWLMGIPFIYFFSGYPFGLLLFPKETSFPERFLISSGLSLLLTYPAGFLNVLWEGQSSGAIFGYHLTSAIFFLLCLYPLSAFLCLRTSITSQSINFLRPNRSWLFLGLPLIVSLIFTFHQLGTPDLNIDEYDLGYQAYDLVDGIFAGRKAFVLSFSAHPPLPMYIQHYTMNVINPQGLDELSDWGFRVSPAILGVLSVITTFLLTKEITSSNRLSTAAATLLAVSNYHLFVSRIFQRESFLVFFLMLSILFLYRYYRTNSRNYLLLSSVFSGAALLVKAVVGVWAAIVAVSLFVKNKNHFLSFTIVVGLMFLPVVIYNLGAYLTTGYMDIFFANIFKTNTHPGASRIVSQPIENLRLTLNLLADQFGFWFFLASVVGLLAGLPLLLKKRLLPLYLLVITLITLFSLIGMQAYYYAIIVPILIILTVVGLNHLFASFPRIIGSAVFVALFLYSAFYSANTLYNFTSVVTTNYTDAFPSLNPSNSSSLTTANFLRVLGWKEVKGKISNLASPTDCLTWDSGVTNIPLRRYLGVEDQVRSYYLGQAYKPNYRVCVRSDEGAEKITIFYNSAGRVDVKKL